MNKPEIELMDSGNLSLTITDNVSWESFPEQATEFVQRFRGTVLKRVDTPVERIWVVLINWRPFFLTFEDLPWRMTLDSMCRFCNPVVLRIHEKMVVQANE